MTTARPIYRPNGVDLATPLDQGAGRIHVGPALEPGLVFPISNTAYDQYNAGQRAIESINLPSLMESTCLETCRWQRTARSVLNRTATYTWSVGLVTPGLEISLDREVCTVDAGGSISMTIAADMTAAPDRIYASVRLTLHETDPETGIRVTLPIVVQTPERIYLPLVRR
jgi:hypothetical protein